LRHKRRHQTNGKPTAGEETGQPDCQFLQKQRQ